MKKSLTVLVALVCGTIATVMASRWLNAQNSGGGVAMADIFVAVDEIDIGDEITPQRIRLEQWPADKVPGGATGELTDLEKRYARQRFYPGEPIMPVKLMDDNWTEVPRDYHVVAMRAADSGIANLIQPGDRVNVVAFFQKNDVVPRSTTKTVLKNLRVYALDGDTERRAGEDKNKSVQNIQLLIHESESEAWELARQMGRTNLVMSNGVGTPDDRGAADEFVQWLTDLQDLNQKQNEPEPPAAPPTSLFPPRRPVAKAPAKPKEEGFVMTKHSGDKVLRYRIIPGQLPQLISELGGENGSPEPAPAEAADETESADFSEDDFNSPFFEN